MPWHHHQCSQQQQHFRNSFSWKMEIPRAPLQLKENDHAVELFVCVCMSWCLSVGLCTCLSVCVSVCLSICVCLYVCICVCLLVIPGFSINRSVVTLVCDKTVEGTVTITSTYNPYVSNT